MPAVPEPGCRRGPILRGIRAARSPLRRRTSGPTSWRCNSFAWRVARSPHLLRRRGASGRRRLRKARPHRQLIGIPTTSAIVATHVIQDASSADTEKPPPMSAISRSTSCEEIVDPNHCDRHHPDRCYRDRKRRMRGVSMCGARARRPAAHYRSFIQWPQDRGGRARAARRQSPHAPGWSSVRAGTHFRGGARSGARSPSPKP